ncbi:cyclin-t1-4 [Phtheirospermum japonicum]|uniref:Cyclin-t1-4 n=1 Tax=Phtheirospermum japonicum TaxID=374723 RepID=A0A830BFC0_9LAMI|nr:cyclin-t1-4 [Phtheirospermum japonicum]
MSLAQPYRPRDGHFYSGGKSSHGRNSTMGLRAKAASGANYNGAYNSNFYITNPVSSCDFSGNLMPDGPDAWPEVAPSSKRRKVSDFSREITAGPYQQQFKYEHGLQNHANLWQHVPTHLFSGYGNAPLVCDNGSAVVAATRSGDSSAYASTTSKRDRSKFEDEEEVVFMSRDEIERRSPSRKDGIDVLHETRLRYSYCAFLQNLGFRLDLPQTTIGTAMVLCHRFFVRRSHASHDRFLIATATLFLASKSEESSRPLNDVLRMASEILHGQEFAVLSYMLPIDWFEQYRERIIEAEQLILTTLNFELGVQHPYESLTSTLQKLGYSQSVLVNLALTLISEGLRSSLWLQFKPHQIAAGAAYLAAKFLNLNLASCHNVWNEFHTPPPVLRGKRPML